MSVPFHKQTDPNKQAGQVVYKVTIIDNAHPEGIPYEDWATPPQPIKVEHTLHHYIESKTEGPPRITFDEWVRSYWPKELTEHQYNKDLFKQCWDVAVARGKVS